MLKRKNLLILLVSLLFLTVLIPTVCAVDNETAIISDETSDSSLVSISNDDCDVLKASDNYLEKSVDVDDDKVSEPVKKSSNVTVTVPSNVKVGEPAKISVDIVDATGNVAFLVDGKETTVGLVNGNAAVTLNNLSAGDHSVVVIYDGDDSHAPAHSVSSFYVADNIAVQPVATEFVNITIFKDSRVSAVLVDEKGNPIANAKVTYVINGESESVETDSEGAFVLKGENGIVISINYAGDEGYLASNTTVKFNNEVIVKMQSTAIVGNNYTQYAVDYGAGERGKNFTVQLVDAKGNVLANKVVLIGYNGKTLSRITDSNGHASVQINLRDANRLTFAVTFLGDEKYEACMAVYLITIKQKPVTITAAAKTFKASAKTKKYTVTLNTIKGDSADGKTYFGEGKKVTLKVNGKTYSGKVNANGKVTFNLKLTKKGKYTATVNFAGDTTYKAASKSAKITIK